MAQPSPSPVRYPAGVSTDFPYGPLANYGMPNPVGYHHFVDDFNWLNPTLTATKTSAGTIASAAGKGGLLLFTTNAGTPLTTDIASIQLPAAAFANLAGKKMFFLTRLKTSSAANSELLAGLIQTTVTPFTVVDGIYFRKPTGAATGLVLSHATASVITSVTIPTSAYTLADDTYIDLGFYVDRAGVIYAFVGSQLVGYLPPAGTGSTNPTRGPSAQLTPAAITAVVLNPTLAIQSGTASSKTMTADFMVAAEER